jgi:hypothetical protein
VPEEGLESSQEAVHGLQEEGEEVMLHFFHGCFNIGTNNETQNELTTNTTPPSSALP